MSSHIPLRAPSTQGFKQLFDRALEEYTNKTGTNLALDPLAETFRGCSSADAAIEVYQGQLYKFKYFRSSGKRGNLISALKPVVEATLALSACVVLGDGLSSLFPPAQAVLGGIGVLLKAGKKVSGSYDTLVGLFGSISNFLERLKIYTDGTHRLASRISAILVKITVQMLSIFALATQQIRQGRLKKYGKILLGQDAEIDDAVKILDKLTAEEQRVVAALTLLNIQDIAADIGRQQLVEWLSPPDPSMNHIDTRSRHHEGTSTWLVNSSAFLEWKENGSLLWISGKPGAGKTFLCSTVIEDLINTPAIPDIWQITTAYFYCSFRDSEKQNIRGLLRSILIQLSTQSNSSYLILSRLFSKKRFNNLKPSNSDLIECLKEMLSCSDGKTYIIVDALDECPNSGTTSERRSILKLLGHLAGLRLPTLRLCVTSRPEDDIGSTLRPLASRHVSLESSREQDGDIIHYIRSMMESHDKMQAWPEKIQKRVIETLSKNAGGMFRYVSCQLDMLCDCDVPIIETALAALPKTLQETYEVTLERIEEGKWQSAHRLFQCLSFSTRPLRVKELAEVLAIDFSADIPQYNADWRRNDPEKAIASVCPGSFVTFVDGKGDLEGKKVVQFAHFSVKEFLVSYISSAQDNLRVARFHIIPEPSHGTLARACLGILFLIGDQPKERSKHPLTKYAARYWVNHARFEDVSLSIMASLRYFFQTSGPYLSAWIQLSDPHLSEVPYSISSKMNQPESLPSNAPLYYAALCGIHHAVKVLHTANPNGIDEIGGRCGAPLCAASSAGHLETAKLLLDLGADTNGQSGTYGPALQTASYQRRINVVQLLLERGADVNAQGGEYGTALKAATYKGSLDVMQLLLGCGADVNAKGGRYGTALHTAVLIGTPDVTQLLLDHGADVNAQGGEYGTALQAAACRGTFDITQLLLQRGADANAQGGEYGTALQAAAHRGSLDITRLLLKHDADVDAQGGKYGTALQAAASRGSLDITRLLLEHGADVNTQGGEFGFALQAAAAYRWSPDVTRLLLDRGANVNAQGGKYGTALQAAASICALDVTQLLLDHGADVNAQGGYYGTALQAAASHGSPDITRLLLEHGANIDSQGGVYGTALQAAAAYRWSSDVTRLLLDRGADVNAQGGKYGNALQAAASSCVLDVARVLLEHGADVNAQGGEYGTALQAAVCHGSLDITQLLLEHGADVNAQSGVYGTALQAAAAAYRRHHTALDIVQCLLEHGADPSIQGGKHGSALQAALSKAYAPSLPR